MQPLYELLKEELFSSDNTEISDIMNEKKDVKRRTINIFILAVFIIMIGIYATLNLLLIPL